MTRLSCWTTACRKVGATGSGPHRCGINRVFGMQADSKCGTQAPGWNQEQGYRWGWFPGWGVGGGVDHRTGRWEDALPTRLLSHGHPCPPPMPGMEFGAERGAELEPLRSLGCHQAWSTSRGRSQGGEVVLPEKGPGRGRVVQSTQLALKSRSPALV